MDAETNTEQTAEEKHEADMLAAAASVEPENLEAEIDAADNQLNTEETEDTEDSKDTEESVDESDKEVDQEETEDTEGKEENDGEQPSLDVDALSKEYVESGELSRETRDDLNKKGIPDSLIDAYLQGLQAIQSQRDGELYNAAGGEEQYNSIMDWAANTLSEQEIDSYQDLLDSPDLSKAKLAIESIKSKYEASYGSDENLVGGEPTRTVDAYESTEQLTTDMANPLYQSDPAFRNKVAQKLARSNIM